MHPRSATPSVSLHLGPLDVTVATRRRTTSTVRVPPFLSLCRIFISPQAQLQGRSVTINVLPVCSGRAMLQLLLWSQKITNAGTTIDTYTITLQNIHFLAFSNLFVVPRVEHRRIYSKQLHRHTNWKRSIRSILETRVVLS